MRKSPLIFHLNSAQSQTGSKSIPADTFGAGLLIITLAAAELVIGYNIYMGKIEDYLRPILSMKEGLARGSDANM